MRTRHSIRSFIRRWAIGLLLSAFLPAESHAQSGEVLPIITPVTACASLQSFDLTAIGSAGSKIVSASETANNGIPFCSVEGTLAPQINFQVLLPTKTWTQRYLQLSCGGLCGRITLQSGASDGCKVLNDGGFVMAATDMGHAGEDGSWGLNRQQRVDFAYRAQHLTAEAAKVLIAAFYGQKQKFAYFNGCSDGGREALMEAQRYPEDFDGVIAGARAMLFQVQNTLYHGWQAVTNTGSDGKIVLLSDKLPVLHKAVIDAVNFDIYTIRPDGSDLLRLTTDRANDAHAVWTADGRILWNSGAYGFRDEAALYDQTFQQYGQIWVMNADGTSKRLLSDSLWEDSMPLYIPARAS